MNDFNEYKYFICSKCGKQIGLYHMPGCKHKDGSDLVKPCEVCGGNAREVSYEKWPQEVMDFAARTVVATKDDLEEIIDGINDVEEIKDINVGLFTIQQPVYKSYNKIMDEINKKIAKRNKTVKKIL